VGEEDHHQQQYHHQYQHHHNHNHHQSMQMKQVSLQLSCQIREKERRTRREGNLFSCNGVELNTEGNLFSGGEARDRRSK
jgi:hypothetical protein